MKKIVFHTSPSREPGVIPDYDTTERAIAEGRESIHTHSMAHLSFALADDGYDIYVCAGGAGVARLYPGMRVGDKEIRKEHNLLRLFRSGMLAEFGAGLFSGAGE